MLGPIVIVLVLAIVTSEIRWRDTVRDLRQERDRLAKEVSLLTDAIARAEKKPVPRPLDAFWNAKQSITHVTESAPSSQTQATGPYWERQDEVVKIIAG